MRTNVRERIAGLLTPRGATYTDLAALVYGVDEPTAAQLSAVRRAVAVLVAEGRAARGGRDYSGKHERINRYGHHYTALNPGETVIYRPA